jgi:hypothetical protein
LVFIKTPRVRPGGAHPPHPETWDFIGILFYGKPPMFVSECLKH